MYCKTAQIEDYEENEIIDWIIPELLQEIAIFPVREKVTFDKKSDSFEIVFTQGIKVYLYRNSQECNKYKIIIYREAP